MGGVVVIKIALQKVTVNKMINATIETPNNNLSDIVNQLSEINKKQKEQEKYIDTLEKNAYRYMRALISIVEKWKFPGDIVTYEKIKTVASEALNHDKCIKEDIDFPIFIQNDMTVKELICILKDLDPDKKIGISMEKGSHIKRCPISSIEKTYNNSSDKQIMYHLKT